MVKLAITNRKILTITLSLIGLFLIVSFYFIYSSTLIRADHFLMDLFFRIRGPVDPGKDIVIVKFDPESYQIMQRKTGGWTRSDFAAAIRTLTNSGADLIAIDYIFAIADPDHPERDQDLANAMRDSANVILASVITQDYERVPYDMFRQWEVGEGFINLRPDEDGVVRRIPQLEATLSENDELLIKSLPFSFQVALARLYPDGEFNPNLGHEGYVQFRDLKVPYAESDEKGDRGFYINFAGLPMQWNSPQHFPSISFHNILHGNFPVSDIKGKIVLIGNMSPFEHDYYRVPFSPSAKVEAADAIQHEAMTSMYGIEIHANAIHTLLTRSFIAPAPRKTIALLLVVLSFVAIWFAIGSRWNAFVNSGISLVILLVFGVICYRLFLSGTFLPASPVFFCVLGISIAGLVARQAAEESEKRYITQLFGRYLAPNVVQELIRHRDLVQFGGRKQRLTMFFSDIRGFTSMSEKLKPEEVSTILNEYFKRMTKLVFKHRGTLDKFMGDAIMAFFGNPIYFPDHARAAVEMALEMREEMNAMLQHWKDQGKEYTFGIGMGINTGEVVVGNLGSDDFFDYTVIGDDVNLACRLESTAKKGQILISASTYEAVKDSFETERLEPVMVKGKSQPVQIYDVIRKR